VPRHSWLVVDSVCRISPGAKFPAFILFLQIVGQIPAGDSSFQVSGDVINRIQGSHTPALYLRQHSIDVTKYTVQALSVVD
jgi:hypothetical protein